MSSVTFTKNLSAENRKNGLWLLGYYFRDSKISKPPFYPITNFNGMVQFLDSKYPTYIESLGEMLKTIQSDKMIQVMKATAARGLTDYPRPSYFSQEILKITGYSFIDTAGDAVAEAAKDIGNGIVFFSRVALIGVIVVGCVYAYTLAGGKLKAPKWLSH